MRVTNGMMVNNMLRDMNNNISRMDSIQQSMATGKKFTRPSQDPIGTSRSLRLNTDISKMEQYKRNVEDAQSWMNTTEIAVGDISDILQRAKELTVQAANETYSQDQRNAVASEIEELKKQLISIGNMNYAGSYIFSGYKTNQPLLDSTGKYDLGSTTAVLDPSENINIDIGVGDMMAVNFVGQRVFGVSSIANPYGNPLSSTSPANHGDSTQLIGTFDQLISDLNSGNMTGINSALGRIESHLTNVNAVRAELGVKSNRLELTINRIGADTENLKTLLSKNEDADMSEVIMNLNMSENVYKASLAASARIITPTLTDFLR